MGQCIFLCSLAAVEQNRKDEFKKWIVFLINKLTQGFCTKCILLLMAVVSNFGAYRERQWKGELKVRVEREALEKVKNWARAAE